MPMAAVVDLFCGIGGLTNAFITEGFNVVAGIDIDPTCEYPYEKNNPGAKFHKKDIAEVTPDFLSAFYVPDNFSILIGCAPCQPFSPYTNFVDKNKKKKDERWKL